MHADKEPRRRIFSRQFSLSMLMLIVTGIGCFLGGRMQGYRRGIAIWDAAPMYTSTYSLVDLLTLPEDKVGSAKTPDAWTTKIKSEVLPGVWMETGGKATARGFAANSSVVVTANGLVHNAISDYLKKIRSQSVATIK